MICSSIILLDDKKNIRVFESSRSIYDLKRKNKLISYELSDEEKLKSKLKRQKIYMVFEGEEFYIRLLKLPRVKNYLMETLVTNELTYIFKDINHFNFTYEVFSKSKREAKVLVFCINSDKNNTFNILSDNCVVRGIYLIQLCFFQHIKKLIKVSKSIIVVQYNNYIYILGSLEGKVIANSILKDFNENVYEFISKVEHVISRANEIEKELKVSEDEYEIITINIENNQFIEELGSRYSCSNLENVDIDKIFSELR